MSEEQKHSNFEHDHDNHHHEHYQHCLFVLGNPLLDMQATVTREYVDHYECVYANAMLAGEKQLPIYDDLMKNYKIMYLPGGSEQNTARVFTWMLQVRHAAVYCGGLGKDKFGQILHNEAKEAGLEVHYQEVDGQPTGTCAVLLVNSERSLVTNLGAANHFKIDHLKQKHIHHLMVNARYYYSSGYFLTVSPDSIVYVGQHAAQEDKVFMTNLAATFIPQFYLKQLLETLPYADYVFGNKDEVIAFAKAMNYETTDVAAIAKLVSQLEKVNKKRQRVVVFTQGPDPVVVCVNGQIQTFNVPPLNPKDIVDMNGAGDGFCGGFISELVRGASLDFCVQAGCYAAQVIINHGCSFPKTPNFYPILDQVKK